MVSLQKWLAHFLDIRKTGGTIRIKHFSSQKNDVISNGFNQIKVSRELPSLHGGSLEITLTVPLISKLQVLSSLQLQVLPCYLQLQVLPSYLQLQVLPSYLQLQVLPFLITSTCLPTFNFKYYLPTYNFKYYLLTYNFKYLPSFLQLQVLTFRPTTSSTTSLPQVLTFLITRT